MSFTKAWGRIKAAVEADLDPRLDALEASVALISYPGVRITDFAADPATVEIGETLESATLVWTLAGAAPTADALTGPGAVALLPADRSATLTGLSLTDTTTYELTATDGGAPAGAIGSATRSVTIPWLSKGHAGTIDRADGSTITSADVNAMAQSWWADGTIARVLSFTTLDPGYIWYSQPAVLPDPSTFALAGSVIAPTRTMRVHTNAQGHTETYADFLLSDRNAAGTLVSLEVIA